MFCHKPGPGASIKSPQCGTHTHTHTWSQRQAKQSATADSTAAERQRKPKPETAIGRPYAAAQVQKPHDDARQPRLLGFIAVLPTGFIVLCSEL